MASRIDYSQNRKLYVGTTAEISLGDGETIIDNKLIIGGSSSSLMLDVASDAIIGSINTSSSTINYENKLTIAGKNNYSDGTTWFGSYGQILLSSNTNMTGSSRQFLITNALDNNKFAIIRSTDANTSPVTNSTATGVNSGTADFVINNTGNVGIGTTGPTDKLTVNGNLSIFGNKIYNGSASNSAGVSFPSSTTRIDGYNGITFHSSQTTVGSQTERMRITNAGDVGIGATPTTGYKLDVVRTTPGYSIVGRHASGGKVGIYNSTGDNGIGTENNYNFNLFTNNSAPQVTLNTAGNVGIGTTSPDYKFEVEGVISSADSALQKATFANVGADLVLTANADATNVTAKMLFKSSGTGGGAVSEKMSIQGDGSVIIGSSAVGGSKRLLMLSADNAVDYDIDFQQNGTTNHGRIRYTEGASDLLFYPITGVSPNLTLKFNGDSYFLRGNVGIGHTTLYQKFTVNGNIDIRGGNGSYLTFNNGDANIKIHDNNVTVQGRDLGFETWKAGVGLTEKMRITRDGNVGIGIASPGAKLQVYSTALRDISIFGHGTQAQNSWQAEHAFFISAGQGVIIGKANASNNTNRLHLFYNTSNGDAQYMLHNTSSTNIVKLNTNGDSFFNGGNVGIGTTSPTGKLEIQRSQVTTQFDRDCFLRLHPSATTDAGGFTNMFFGTSTVNNYGVAIGGKKAGTGDTSSNNNPEFSVRILNDAITGIEVLNINTTGSVKFNAYNGTNNTGSPTHILGTDANGLIVKSTAGSSIGPWLPLAAGSGDPLTGVLYAGQGVKFTGGTIAAATTVLHTNNVVYARGGSSGMFLQNADGSDGIFIANDHIRLETGSAERMRILSGGNVGIGTTSPGAKLDVKTATAPFTALKVSNYGTNVNALYAGAIDDAYLYFGSGFYYNSSKFRAPSTTAAITSYDSGVFRVFTNSGLTANTDYIPTERMRITSSGNVGIGMTNPAVPLDVEGKIRSNDSNSGDYLEIFCDGSVSGDSYIENTNNNIQIKSAFATSFSTSGSVAMFINNSQNVGIGTTSPGTTLDVNGIIKTNAIFRGDTLNNNANTHNIIYRSGTSTFIAGGDKLVVQDGGNVGIGTNSPSAKLSVIGDIDFGGGNNNGIIEVSGSGDLIFKYKGSDPALTLDGGAVKTIVHNRLDALNIVNINNPSNNESILNIRDDDSSSNGHIAFENSSEVTGIVSSGTDFINFRAGDGVAITDSPMLTLLNNRIGINTTSPNSNVALDVDGRVLIKDSNGVADFYLGNYATANHFRFHTNNADTYFDMNCGNIYWRDGASTRYTFFPSTANMTVNGTITQNSDARVKENIVEIGDCISKVQAMKGVYYNRTDFNTEATKVGVIAQDVEAVLPELIIESPEDGLKSVAYSELTAVLINAIKEQQEIIEDLKTRITKLEN